MAELIVLSLRFLGLCLDCIINQFDLCRETILAVHQETRKEFGLPPRPPKAKEGIGCQFCVNHCRIGEDQISYCTVQKVV